MTPFNQFLYPSSLIRPVHITLAEPHPNLRSLVRTIEDPYYHPSSQHRSSQHHSDVSSPSFDVRESESAFSLEGEFPGVCRKEDVTIEKLGPRILLVESRAARFEVDAEWGWHFAVGPPVGQEAKTEEQRQQDQGMSGLAERGTGGQDLPLRDGGRGEEEGLHARLEERHVGEIEMRIVGHNGPKDERGNE